MRPLFIALAALLVQSPAHAQVYKCTVDGKTVFSGTPCVANDTPLDLRPATGHAPAVARKLREQEREQRRLVAEQQQAAAEAKARTTETRRAEAIAEYEAQRARHEQLRAENLAARERYFEEHGHYGEHAPDLRAPDMTPCGDRRMAYVMSQQGVKAHLRAPSTARFPTQPSATEFIGDCRWAVVGTVEASNALGVQLMHRYSATMEYSSIHKSWRAVDVNIEPVR